MKIEKLNHQGHGIGYVDNKITFVAKAIPGDHVEIKITKTDKKTNEAKIISFNHESDKRVVPKCPVFEKCGGCDLLNMSYEDTLLFKRNKVKEIFLKYANLEINPEMIASSNINNYRNKITIKINNGKIGYYEESTHYIVETDNCLIAQESINNFIKDIPSLKIKNGEITIRANYNDELLINIDSKDKIKIKFQELKTNHKIVGFIINHQLVNGEAYFIDKINEHLFQVSYNSFFQVNRSIFSEILTYSLGLLKKSNTLLDLYCGVGTFSTFLSPKFKKVYGIEIVHSAIKDALINNKINNITNIDYLLGAVEETVSKIEAKIDTIVVDPPRAGVDKQTMVNIINLLPKEILYVSCNAITLARDIRALSDKYQMEGIKLFDMFPYTAHVECVVLLQRKKI